MTVHRAGGMGNTENADIYFLCSGGWKSKVRALAGPPSLRRLQGPVPPASSSPWWPRRLGLRAPRCGLSSTPSSRGFAAGLVRVPDRLFSSRTLARGRRATLTLTAPAQTLGLLLFITVLPCALMFISHLLYKKHYKLDEDEYSRICGELAKRAEGVQA